MRAEELRRTGGHDEWMPVTQGFICLQSKCGEIFYRDIEIRTITGIPDNL